MEWLSESWRSLASFVGSSVLSTAFLTGIAFLTRDAIREWLTAKAKHGYDVELEELRAALAKSGKEVEALRAAPMSARATRQAQIDKRRLEAVDQLWSAVKDLGPSKAAATWMAVIKFEPLAELSKSDQRVRDLFQGIASRLRVDEPLGKNSHAARPFVSPLAWALFSAYASAAGLSHARLLVLQSGFGSEALGSPDAVLKLLIEALPDWKEYIDQFGVTCFPYLLDELEKRLLAELQRTLAGEEDDANEIEKARKIIERVNDIEISMSKMSIPAELRQTDQVEKSVPNSSPD